MKSIRLPSAVTNYRREEEQVFRDHVRRGIEGCVARESVFNPQTNKPLFLGQPHAQAVGTDAAFSVAGGSALVYLPINSFQMTNPNLVEAGEFKALYSLDVEINASVYHPSPGGGSSLITYTLYFSIWDGSVYTLDISTGAITMEANAGWHLTFSYMRHVAKGKMVRMRLAHTGGSAQLFDLTKSFMNIKQLGNDPGVVETRQLT